MLVHRDEFLIATDTYFSYLFAIRSRGYHKSIVYIIVLNWNIIDIWLFYISCLKCFVILYFKLWVPSGSRESTFHTTFWNIWYKFSSNLFLILASNCFDSHPTELVKCWWNLHFEYQIKASYCFWMLKSSLKIS